MGETNRDIAGSIKDYGCLLIVLVVGGALVVGLAIGIVGGIIGTGGQIRQPVTTTTMFVPSNDPWDENTRGYRDCRSEFPYTLPAPEPVLVADLYDSFEDCLEAFGAVRNEDGFYE